MKNLSEAYHALCDVYIRGSYVGEAVKEHALSADAALLRIVYGTIEHHFLYEYRLSRLVEKPPKKYVAVLLKMVMYLVDYMDGMPNYTAVNETVNLAQCVGKSGVAGFVNAVLRRYLKIGRSMLPKDETELLSVKTNRPVWLVKRYIEECGIERATAILTAKGSVQTHVRPSAKFGQDALRAYLEEKEISYEETPYGFNLTRVGKLAELLHSGKATVMSVGSIEICNAVPKSEGELLDMCAAPGGKSVYLAERRDGKVLATDLHSHRVDLICAYAKRMGVENVEASVKDHTVYDPAYEGRFSVVLLDAPCSGCGTVASNPDVVLHRQEKDMDEIIRTQRSLLENAGRYVRAGGTIVYSTCSDLPSEDEWIVAEFMKKHAGFVLVSEKHTETNEKGGEGYYYAVLEKK